MNPRGTRKTATRTLLFVPIIHSSADLGSLAEDVAKKGISGLGEVAWKTHQRTVQGFWDAIIEYFSSVDVSGMLIYQDGMVADGEIGEKIVEEGVRSGSKNYELVAKLQKRGATLVKTEDFNLVKEEHDHVIKLIQARTEVEKINALKRYTSIKASLLHRRDGFIARRIHKTLHEGRTGILLLGAYHDIEPTLPEDIRTIEIKNARKVREYKDLLPFSFKNRQRFEELGDYLVSKIAV